MKNRVSLVAVEMKGRDMRDRDKIKLDMRVIES